MKIVRTVEELRRGLTGRVGLVPTMGALHEGHLSLMRECRTKCDTLVASVFVNPTQFGPNEDLDKYPRQETLDAKLAESTGIDLLFCPSLEEVYPGDQVSVHVHELASRYEGAVRPGHYNGVATVVLKLFEMSRCDVAIFGQKDLQQFAVISALAKAFYLPIDLIMHPTIRESDGLALSSRNVFLSAEERGIARGLSANLFTACAELKAGSSVDMVLAAARDNLGSVGFKVDYFDLVDTSTFSPTRSPIPGSALITAARLGTTRLIDNVLL